MKKTVKKAPAKAPAGFRKPIPAAAFNRRFAGMLEQRADIEFFRSCFDERDGAFAVRRDLDAKATKRLGKLRKAIKANLGVFKAGPILALTLAGGGLAVFGLFFMNPVIEKAVESGLSSAFGARAEVDGLRFSPFGMSLSMARVAVADREAPMTNLFETGRLALRLDPAAALRGKVYIVEAVADSIAAGTPRAVSGALPDEPAKPEADEPEAPAPAPLVDFKNFDAKALLEREKAKLATTAAWAEASAAYAEANGRWAGRAASSTAAVEGLESSTASLLAIDPKKLTKPEDVAKAAAEVKKGMEAVQAAAAEAKAISAGVAADAKRIAELEKAARDALAADIGYLVSFVDPRSGTAMAALEPSVREVLSDKAERWLYYASRAWEALSRIRNAAPEKDKPAAPRKPGPRGRTVYFPSVAHPAFRLGLLRSSFTVGGREWSVELREASSEPALVPAPASAELRLSGGGLEARVYALADLRVPGAESWEADLEASGLPLNLGDSLAGVGLGGFSATLAGGGRAAGRAGGGFELASDLDLVGARVASPSGTLGTAFADALADAGEIRAAMRWTRSPGAMDAFSLKTNLDELVGAAVSAVARRYADKAMAEVESAARAYAAEEFGATLPERQELDGIVAAAKGDQAAVDKLKASLDQKLKDLEARAAALGAGALQGLGLPALPGLPTKKP